VPGLADLLVKMAAKLAAKLLFYSSWSGTMSRVLSILVVLGTALLSRAVQAGFPELANLVPSDTNALVMIDMDKLLASPAAEKGDWKNKIENAFEEGLTILPPKARRAILASQIDLEFMTQLWQTELLDVTEPT